MWYISNHMTTQNDCVQMMVCCCAVITLPRQVSSLRWQGPSILRLPAGHPSTPTWRKALAHDSARSVVSCVLVYVVFGFRDPTRRPSRKMLYPRMPRALVVSVNMCQLPSVSVCAVDWLLGLDVETCIAWVLSSPSHRLLSFHPCNLWRRLSCANRKCCCIKAREALESHLAI